MGYYKQTTYYGPNSEDHADNSPEAVAERKQPTTRAHVGRWPDLSTCLVCEAQAPEGQSWVEGICAECRDLSSVAGCYDEQIGGGLPLD